MKEKDHVFDRDTSFALKGIAILMLLFHHSFGNPGYYENYMVFFWSFAETQINNMALSCKICVAIFAFISGYGLFLNYQKIYETMSASKWCIIRYLKSFSGYWFAWMMIVIVRQIIDRKTVEVFFADGIYKGIAYILINFLGLSQLFNTPTLNMTWWYMSAAFTFILVLPILYHYRDSLVLVIVLDIVFIRLIFGGNIGNAYTGENSVYPFIISFILGCFFARYSLFDYWANITHRRWTRTYIFLVEIWLVMLGYKFYHNIPRAMFWEFHYGLYTVCVILLCVELLYVAPFLKRALYYVGKHSMNIFLTHSIILTYLKRFIMIPKLFILELFILLVMCIVLSIVLEILKKGIGYNKLIERLERTVDNLVV